MLHSRTNFSTWLQGRSTRWVLPALLVAAFALRMIAAYRQPNVYHPDELFQTQEPAHRMAFGYGVVTWEWRDGIRSYVFPFLLSLLMRATVGLGQGSFGYEAAIRIVLSLLSLPLVWFCYRWAEREAGKAAAVIAGLGATFCYVMVLLAPKTLSEVVATDALLPGILLAVLARERNARWQMVASGVLLGLAMGLRLQYAPMVLVAMFWICWRQKRRDLPPMLLGWTAALLLFGVVDVFTLGYPFASFVRYFSANLIAGKSLEYGVKPWSFLFQSMWEYCWIFVLLALPAIRRSTLLWVLLAVVVGSHSVLAHKEFRFVFAAVPLLVTLAGIGCVELARWMAHHVRPRFDWVFLLVVSVVLPSWYLRQYRLFADSRGHGGQVLVADVLSKDPKVCGVGLWRDGWRQFAGYAQLHHNVPVLLLPEDADVLRESSAVNLLISPAPARVAPQGYALGWCVREVCVYRRPGGCLPATGDEINAHLQRTGQ